MAAIESLVLDAATNRVKNPIVDFSDTEVLGLGAGAETDPIFGASEAFLFVAGDKAFYDGLEAIFNAALYDLVSGAQPVGFADTAGGPSDATNFGGIDLTALLASEADPIFGASEAVNFVSGDKANLDAVVADVVGLHDGSGGYVLQAAQDAFGNQIDTFYVAQTAFAPLSDGSGGWVAYANNPNDATNFGGVDLTALLASEADPIFSASEAFNFVAGDKALYDGLEAIFNSALNDLVSGAQPVGFADTAGNPNDATSFGGINLTLLVGVGLNNFSGNGPGLPVGGAGLTAGQLYEDATTHAVMVKQ